MKKFKSKALKKKGKKSKVVSDDETEEEKALTKKALKDKPKSTIEKEDSDDEVAEASDKSSDAAEFSDGEYIPAKKSVANDSESEDDDKRLEASRFPLGHHNDNTIENGHVDGRSSQHEEGEILAVSDKRSGKVK